MVHHFNMIVVIMKRKDSPVIIPIDRLRVTVMRSVQMWNTAKRDALKIKGTIRIPHLLNLFKPVIWHLHSYIVWSSKFLICRTSCATHPRKPDSPCVLRMAQVSWHSYASSMWTWKRWVNGQQQYTNCSIKGPMCKIYWDLLAWNGVENMHVSV